MEEHGAAGMDAMPLNVSSPASNDLVVNGNATLLALAPTFTNHGDHLHARVENMGNERSRLLCSWTQVAQEREREAFVLIELARRLDQ